MRKDSELTEVVFTATPAQARAIITDGYTITQHLRGDTYVTRVTDAAQFQRRLEAIKHP